jgi:hypothetical protein
MSEILSRRSFFTGAASAVIAAPAIVRASSLMPVRAVTPLLLDEYRFYAGWQFRVYKTAKIIMPESIKVLHL